MTRTMPAIREMLRTEIERIWDNPEVLDGIPFIVEVTNEVSYMMLITWGFESKTEVRAIDTTIVKTGKHYHIQINPKLLALDDDEFVGLLRHEIIHIGYGRHDAEFRAMCRRFGAIINVSELRGEGIQIQAKFGGRYKTIAFADNIEEAHEKSSELREFPGQKMRIRY